MKATYKLQLKQLLASTLLLTMLVGCGQSGPLYLPDENPRVNKLNTQSITQQQKTPTISQQQEQ
ncbi:lipoprotein [Pseudoalteromonas sp. MMG010]|uniref:LPS translocon maturation chaperone LptM n=1 Tax=Pseudoalteromonas sp. MMG010 TaxID=2822685 RepID=UPI001B39E41B|nr:lipoprotein [Pseudoalteromonas sp. MMG010]MBQ4834100.1 lipoprotein [Pseudoalteromonas sp. MMG010]